jgi:hypothetical protein
MVRRRKTQERIRAHRCTELLSLLRSLSAKVTVIPRSAEASVTRVFEKSTIIDH